MDVKENISSILILFIIILLTVDYYSMFDFGFKFNHFSYILDYKELITINLPIITIFLLLSFLSKKHSLVFFLTLSLILIIYLLTYDSKPFNDIMVISFIYTLIIFISLSGTHKFQNYIKKKYLLSYENNPFLITFTKIVLSFFFTIFIIIIYSNLNKNFNNIYKNDTEYHFNTNKIEDILFKAKIFTTNRLENIQDDISFINSKIYVEKLNELNVLTDEQFKINDSFFYSTYLKNNNFKTLFIIDKRTFINNEISLIIIFTEKISENKYQILNILEKKINVIEDKTKS
ncbi:hypothetical protein L5F39_04780 [Aliarcobacter butzleri]|uniref:hypothetical protein n=1 Tax=Aliarcobacter butzleri TaxID=28197 RepID=UPI001EDFB5B5|nr:hypothetical protein [Aliarcobacter butzleri]MCG3696927.1 hypothetical protein [Aliarcobacter butzleri]